MAFFKVLVIDCCPTTVSKVCGLYLRADTMKFPIDASRSLKSFKYKRCFQILPFLKLEDINNLEELVDGCWWVVGRVILPFQVDVT